MQITSDVIWLYCYELDQLVGDNEEDASEIDEMGFDSIEIISEGQVLFLREIAPEEDPFVQ